MQGRDASYLSRRMTNHRREIGIVLWAADDYCAEEEAWRTGWGDISYGARRLPVPALVQLGVLAHASWPRLNDLRQAGPGSRILLVWGTGMLGLVNRLLDQAPGTRQLRRLQQGRLIPLERDLLNAGRSTISRSELIELVAAVLQTEPAG